MILIVSSRTGDGHVRPVLNELLRRGQQVTVVNPAEFPECGSVTLQASPRATRGTLHWDGCEIDLADVTAVWYRRPGDFQLSEELTTAERGWVTAESNHLFRGMWHNLDALWVSSPEALRTANLKLVQLNLATRLGFDVPSFVVTNVAADAADFIARCPHGAVVKTLAQPHIIETDRVGTLYTHFVTDADVKVIEAVRFGPTLLQEFQPKRMDIRVTVIGSRVFAVGIHSADQREARVDFRRVEVYKLRHSVVSLPEQLAARCVQLVERLGLRFGAIDLVLTSDGRYRFLEINPNGQWFWLEQITGLPLAAAMSDLLVGK